MDHSSPTTTSDAPASTTRTVEWYFDFISPFAYLQWQAVRRLPGIARSSSNLVLRSVVKQTNLPI